MTSLVINVSFKPLFAVINMAAAVSQWSVAHYFLWPVAVILNKPFESSQSSQQAAVFTVQCDMVYLLLLLHP